MTDTERLNELEDVKRQMKSRGGRRLLWRILEMAGIYHSSFSLEPLLMANKEGARNIGLMLLADIMAVDPDGYILMAREAKARDDQKAKEAELERRNKSESE